MSSTQNDEPKLTRQEELDNIDAFTKDLLENILTNASCCEEHDAEMKILIPAIGEMCKQLLGRVSPMTMAKGTLLYGRTLGAAILKDVLPDAIASMSDVDPDKLRAFGKKIMGGNVVEEAIVDSIQVTSGNKRTLH